MNFSCDNCQRRYAIADEKVRGKTVKIRCKNCQNIITLTGPEPEPEIPEEDRTRMVPLEQIEKMRASSVQAAPAAASASASTAAPPKAPWDEEPTRTAPPVDPTSQWFAMVKGKQIGPLDANDLVQRVGTGELTLRTYMWKQGMADWKRSADIPELAAVIAGGLPSSSSAVAEASPRRARTMDAPRAVAVQEEEPAARYEDEEETTGRASESASAAEYEPRRRSSGWTDEDRGDDAHDATDRSEPTGAEEPSEPAHPQRPSMTTSSDDLFSDLDLHRQEDSQGDATSPSPGVASSRGADPFASLGSVPLGSLPASESTNAYIARSGVKNRNPAWKIALFVVLLIGLPVGVLYALSEMKVVPLQVTRVNAAGQEVKESVFSAEGVAGLRDLLMGRKPQAAAPAPTPRPKPPTRVADAKPPPTPDKPAATGPANEDLRKLYETSGKTDVSPIARKDPAVESASSKSEGGLPEEEAAKVVAQYQKAFQNCIDTEMRKNPSFKAGKIVLTATVGGSGAVKSAAIDQHDVDTSPLGECLKTRAKKMAFKPFAGDEADVQIPLILGKAM